jgi:glycyl-tRNA synthetase alpha chain
VRALARLVAQSYYDSRERLGFPMCRSTSAAKAKDGRERPLLKQKKAK